MSNVVLIGAEAYKRHGEDITLTQLAQAEDAGLWKDPESWMIDNENGCSIYSFAGFHCNKIGYKRLPKIQQEWLNKYVKEPLYVNGQLNIKECVRAKWRWEADNNMFHGDWDNDDMVTRASDYYKLNPKDVTLHIPEDDVKISKILSYKLSDKQ